MNNITPIRSPQQQDWWVQQPGCPPQPGCGPSPPSCFSQVAKANECWDQSQSLYNLVMKVVQDIFEKCPGIIPTPPPGTASGPLIGVTDGSSAQPGQVGEFFRFAVNVPFAAAVVTDVNISLGVIQPGDWDLWAGLDLGQGTGPTSFYVNVAAPGLSNGLHTAMGAFVGQDESDWSVINAAAARITCSVPTLMAFRVVIDNAVTGATAGNSTMWMEGRRRR